MYFQIKFLETEIKKKNWLQCITYGSFWNRKGKSCPVLVSLTSPFSSKASIQIVSDWDTDSYQVEKNICWQTDGFCIEKLLMTKTPLSTVFPSFGFFPMLFLSPQTILICEVAVQSDCCNQRGRSYCPLNQQLPWLISSYLLSGIAVSCDCQPLVLNPQFTYFDSLIFILEQIYLHSSCFLFYYLNSPKSESELISRARNAI